MADETDRSAELIEQLLNDPTLRADFRADPASILRDHGLSEMAEGLPAGQRAMLTLELRESRSSLAGAIVAAAAEGIDFTHAAEHAGPRLGHDAGRAISHLVSRLTSHPKPTAAPPPPAPAHGPGPEPVHHHAASAPPKPRLGPAPRLPQMATPSPPPPAEPVQPVQPPLEPAAHQEPAVVDPVDAAPAPVAPSPSLLEYPGDGATPAQIAAWMGANAQRAGLPPELPVMASLTESGMRNLSYGDRDSVGFFQMRLGIWDQGAYSGFPTNPQLQLEWFINEALAARQADPSLSESPGTWGEWVANIERPAAEYRYRYQLQLPEAESLIRRSGLPALAGAMTGVDPSEPATAGVPTGAEPAGAEPTGAGPAGAEPTADPTAAAPTTVQPVFHGVIHRPPLGRAVTATATACVGARCAAGGGDVETGFDGAGLVKYAYGKQGIDLPTAPEQQFAVGAVVPRGALQGGDAVFFGRSPDRIEDVGIYVGDGKVVTAAPEKGVVSIDSLASAGEHYLGARRYSEKLLTGAESYARALPTITRKP